MKQFPEKYVIIDIETTGLNPNKDCIIEVASIKVEKGGIISEYQRLVKIDNTIPQNIINLTKINNQMLDEEGVMVETALNELKEFIGYHVIISHNISFDLRFLNYSMEEIGISPITNQGIDTLILARKLKKGLKSYQLEWLLDYFGTKHGELYRGLTDALSTKLLYDKLIEISEQKKIGIA